MNKVNKLKKKMNTYYSDLQPQKFISDLEASGFKVGSTKENHSQLSPQLMANREIAAGMDPKETIISKDGSLAVVLK